MTEHELEMQLRRAGEYVAADKENLPPDEYHQRQLNFAARLIHLGNGKQAVTVLAVQNAVKHCKALYGDDCFEQLDKLKQEGGDG